MAHVFDIISESHIMVTKRWEKKTAEMETKQQDIDFNIISYAKKSLIFWIIWQELINKAK